MSKPWVVLKCELEWVVAGRCETRARRAFARTIAACRRHFCMCDMTAVRLADGGTSVATYKNWGVIAKRTKELLPTNRVWLVVSALSSVSARCAASGSSSIMWRGGSRVKILL